MFQIVGKGLFIFLWLDFNFSVVCFVCHPSISQSCFRNASPSSRRVDCISVLHNGCCCLLQQQCLNILLAICWTVGHGLTTSNTNNLSCCRNHPLSMFVEGNFDNICTMKYLCTFNHFLSWESSFVKFDWMENIIVEGSDRCCRCACFEAISYYS